MNLMFPFQNRNPWEDSWCVLFWAKQFAPFGFAPERWINGSNQWLSELYQGIKPTWQNIPNLSWNLRQPIVKWRLNIRILICTVISFTRRFGKTDHKSPTWLILRWPQLISRWFMCQCDASLYPNQLVTETRFTSQKTHQETCKASGFCWKGQLEEKLTQGQTPVRSMNSGMMWGQEGKKFIVGGLINDASSKAEITHFLQMSSWTRPGMRQLGGEKSQGIRKLVGCSLLIFRWFQSNTYMRPILYTSGERNFFKDNRC